MYSRNNLIVLSLIFLFAACKTDKAPTVADDTLDIAISNEPSMIHPYVYHVASARAIYQNIFLPLADFHPDTYELIPILIKEIPQERNVTDGPYAGGVQYDIEFREDAVWEDGSPITANDLLFSFKAVMHPGTNTAGYASYAKWVTDIKIDDNNPKKASLFFKDYYILAKELVSTIEIYPQYFYDPENALSAISYTDITGPDAQSLIDAEEKLKTFAENFNSVKYGRESISGAGPYTFKNWISNQLIVLEKKADYWGEKYDNPFLKAGPDKLIFHVIADETATITQLKEGNIDLFANMSANAFFDLKENEVYGDDFQYFTPELMKFYYIAVNNSKPELADPDVRRALAELVDVDKMVDVIERGLGKRTVSIVNEKKPYYNKNLSLIRHDVEHAKSTLSEEGWKDTNGDGSVDKMIDGQKVEMDLDMYITGSELSKNVALLFQESAKQAGVKINIITKAYSQFKKENLKKRDYDLSPLVIGQDLVLDDPYSKWHSENDDPTQSNDVSYRSPEADALIEKIRSTKDENERNQYYLQLQEVMYKDQPVIFLYNPMEKIILSKKWSGSATMKRPGYMPNTFVSG